MTRKTPPVWEPRSTRRLTAALLASMVASAFALVASPSAHSSDISPSNTPFDSCGTVIVDELYYCYLFHADADDNIYHVPGIDEYAYSPGDRLHVQGSSEFAAGFCTVHGNVLDPTINPCDENTCTGDLNGDGNVGVEDLLSVLDQWGVCGYNCSADLTGDEHVGVDDLLVLLGAWGACE